MKHKPIEIHSTEDITALFNRAQDTLWEQYEYEKKHGIGLFGNPTKPFSSRLKKQSGPLLNKKVHVWNAGKGLVPPKS